MRTVNWRCSVLHLFWKYFKIHGKTYLMESFFKPMPRIFLKNDYITVVFLWILWKLSEKLVYGKPVNASSIIKNILVLTQHTLVTLRYICAGFWHSIYGYSPDAISNMHMPKAYTSTDSSYRSSYISGAINSGVPIVKRTNHLVTILVQLLV